MWSIREYNGFPALVYWGQYDHAVALITGLDGEWRVSVAPEVEDFDQIVGPPDSDLEDDENVRATCPAFILRQMKMAIWV